MSSTTLFRLSGLAMILGFLIFVVSAPLTAVATGMSLYSHPLYLPARVGQIVGGALLLSGLPGLYLRQAGKVGKFGLVSFGLTFLGLAAHWNLMPTLAFVYARLAARPETQALVAQEGALEDQLGQVFMAYYAVSVLAAYLGIILLGIATLRARVFPRGAAVCLIIGIPATFIMLASGFAQQGPIQQAIASAFFWLGFAWCGYSLWAEREPVYQAVPRTDLPHPA